MPEIANFQSARIVNNPHGQSEIHRHCRKSAHAKYNPQISSKNPHGFIGIRKPYEESARSCRNPQSLAEIRTRQRMMRRTMQNEGELGARYGRAKYSDGSDEQDCSDDSDGTDVQDNSDGSDDSDDSNGSDDSDGSNNLNDSDSPDGQNDSDGQDNSDSPNDSGRQSERFRQTGRLGDWGRTRAAAVAMRRRGWFRRAAIAGDDRLEWHRTFVRIFQYYGEFPTIYSG